MKKNLIICVLLMVILWLAHGVGMLFWGSVLLDWTFKIVKIANLAWLLVMLVNFIKGVLK